MAQNTSPIFTGVPDIQWNTTTLVTANTAMDGTGTVVAVFSADATNGGFVQKIRIQPLGTNVATVLRIFINNGSVNTTAANNTLFAEISLPATAANTSASLTLSEIPMNIALPAGYKLYATIGTSIAAGIAVTTVGGKY